jgi:hypothetical protein
VTMSTPSNSTTTSSTPERINTPLDELMRDVRDQTRRETVDVDGTSGDQHHDGPMSLSTATHLGSAASSDHTHSRQYVLPYQTVRFYQNCHRETLFISVLSLKYL